ncbi:MAG: hypothetical protein HT580_14210 [Dechloromonas sp.]|nr:MAG: hypothetical protein HT580_14210 [Dechloromonas sp.]
MNRYEQNWHYKSYRRREGGKGYVWRQNDKDQKEMAIEKAQNNLLGNFPMNSVSNQLSKFTTSLKI